MSTTFCLRNVLVVLALLVYLEAPLTQYLPSHLVHHVLLLLQSALLDQAVPHLPVFQQPRDYLAYLSLQLNLYHLLHQVNRLNPVDQENLAIQVRQSLLSLLDFPAHQVLLLALVNQVHLSQQVHLEALSIPVNQANLVHLDVLVVLPALLGLKIPVRLCLLAVLVNHVFREGQLSLDGQLVLYRLFDRAIPNM